jgi:hypothetical protein
MRAVRQSVHTNASALVGVIRGKEELVLRYVLAVNCECAGRVCCIPKRIPPLALSAAGGGRLMVQSLVRWCSACLLVLSSALSAPPPKPGDYVDRFCRGANSVMERAVIPSVRDAVKLREATPQGSGPPFWPTVRSPPELPGLSRPTWLVITASVPTALGWYGYYKFSVEEELFYDELRREGRVSGCGGYGTLFPFVYCVLLGGLGVLFDVPNSDKLIELGSVWILLGQVNLYRRVNELLVEAGKEPAVHAWWALLPPPLDVVVGLRQIHFLARYWSERRGDEWAGDPVAEVYFPFIAREPRFTLREFATTPSMWFWLTREWDDFDLPGLVDDGNGGRTQDKGQ